MKLQVISRKMLPIKTWLCVMVGVFYIAGSENAYAKRQYNGLFKYLPDNVAEGLIGPNQGAEELNSSDFIIIHSHNFDNNTLGNYVTTEKRSNWGNVGGFSYDNRPGHPRIVNFDGGKRAMNEYLAGSKGDFTTSGNGADFAGALPAISDEIYHTYRIHFEKGFDFYANGKLPGFRMWPAIPAGQGLNPGNNGSIIYLTWTSKGELVWNVYHHKNTVQFGDRMGKPNGFFTMESGKWYEITFRIVLNTPGISNGILQIWVDGDLRDTVTGVLFRTTTSVQNINQQVIITFMDWDISVRKTQYMWMDDFFVWKYSDSFLQANPQVARGLNVHTNATKIYNPLSLNRPSSPSISHSVVLGSSPAEGGVVRVKTSN